MKIVLLENLRKLGTIGEIINVKRGYARNFLIPEKKALFASEKNIKQVEKINKKEFKVKKLSTENKELYGSVKPSEISKILKEKADVDLSSSLIQPVKEIKSIGEFKVILNLHSEIESFIKIKVTAEENIK